MSKQGRPPLDELFDLAGAHLDTDNAELITLKGHVLAEVALAHLLATRLGADERVLPPMRFEALMAVAFAGLTGPMVERAQAAVGNLNALRNDLAHRLHSDVRQDRMRDIASVGAAGLKAAGIKTPFADFSWNVPEDERIRRYRLGVDWILAALHTIASSVQAVIKSPSEEQQED